MIAMGMHFTAAHRATVNDNPIRRGFTLHAQCQQTVGHHLDAGQIERLQRTHRSLEPSSLARRLRPASVLHIG